MDTKTINNGEKLTEISKSRPKLKYKISCNHGSSATSFQIKYAIRPWFLMAPQMLENSKKRPFGLFFDQNPQK